MRAFSMDGINNVNYEQTESTYQKIDTTGFNRIETKGVFQNLVVAFASYKTGVSEKNGKTQEWEIVSLSLADVQKRLVMNVVFNPVSNYARYCELVYLTDVKDEKGNPGIKYVTTQNGTNIIEDLIGKTIDIAVDRPVMKAGGYVDLRIRGFFRNGFSAREVLNKAQQPKDIQTVFNTLEDGPAQNNPFGGQQSSNQVSVNTWSQPQQTQAQPANWSGQSLPPNKAWGSAPTNAPDQLNPENDPDIPF